jgi:hypothetical protein
MHSRYCGNRTLVWRREGRHLSDRACVPSSESGTESGGEGQRERERSWSVEPPAQLSHPSRFDLVVNLSSRLASEKWFLWWSLGDNTYYRPTAQQTGRPVFYLFIYLFVVYLPRSFRKSDYISSNERMIGIWWMAKVLEGSVPGLTEGNILAFAWRDRVKQRKAC